MLDGRLSINAPNVVNEEFDGEFVVLNLANGTYFSFRESGNLLWRAVMDGVPPAALIAAMEKAANPHVGAARAFFDRLVALELVKPAEGGLAAAGVGPEVAAIASDPAVDVFDDLADLILADPIHDTDAAAGWPVKRVD